MHNNSILCTKYKTNTLPHLNKHKIYQQKQTNHHECLFLCFQMEDPFDPCLPTTHTNKQTLIIQFLIVAVQIYSS